MSITEEKVIKYKTSNSLEFFIRYFFKELHGRKFVMNEHHYQIIDVLERVISGELTRVIFNIAPRYSKTEITVKNLIAFCIALNSKAKFIHLSYSDTLALDNSEAIKDFIQSEQFQKIYNVEIKKDSKSKKKWYTVDGGGVYATSAGGQVTGFGAGKVDDDDEIFEEFSSYIETAKGFGGAIIIDDPIKPDDADSDTIREKINNRFDSTIRSRTNSRNTPIIVVMQRLHPEDLSGYLLEIEPTKWHVLSLPAIKDDGTALWSWKHTIEELNDLKSANESVFQRQYMQDPSPSEGLMFPKEDLNLYDENNIDQKKFVSTNAFDDIADTGTDYLSCPFGSLFDGDNRIFIHDVVFTQEGTETNVSMCVERINKHNAEFVQIESNFGGTMYIQLMNASTDPPMNGFSSLIPMNARSNKHTRIQTMSGFIKRYCYFKNDFSKNTEYGRFMNQLIKYTKTGKGVKNDDAPDSLSGLVKMILTYFPELWDVVYQAQAESIE